jgi:signal transduction histidine kinase
MMKADDMKATAALSQIPPGADWKTSLEAWYIHFRKAFIFDNLAIYLLEEASEYPDVVFARATGRGRSKESDASWGEEIANQVITLQEVIDNIPEKKDSSDRTTMPYLLGLPLLVGIQRGALVFVRFGGPEFTSEQLPLAVLAAVQTSRVLEQRFSKENLENLEQIRRKAQLQDDFIATISHELRTPLGFIKGYATSLLRPDTSWDPETQKEFLSIIDEESDRLIELIDCLLDSAKLQSGMAGMDFQPVQLDSLIKDVTRRIQARQEDLQIVLELPSVPPILADNVRLNQVFENLIDNSIKYAPQEPITLSLQVVGNKQVVTLSDRGPGIPKEHIPFLFQRFYRIPNQKGKAGTGLGLFICRQIIQAHQGEISVITSPGKGTTFKIALPAHPGLDEKED